MHMKKERNIFMTKSSDFTKNSPGLIPYHFFYWGPLLCRMKIQSKALKECAKLCSKKSSDVNEKLVGVIKHAHYISAGACYKVLEPYLNSFREAHQQWYGTPLTKDIMVRAAWANFMKAGEFNPPHIHTGCDFSCVLFVKVPEKLKEENKKFTGLGGGPGSLSFTYGESQPHSLSRKYFFPEEGELFIFPAILSHFVAPFLSKGERISMSANFKLE